MRQPPASQETRWGDVHREELASLDELGVCADSVYLNVDEEPALPENVVGVDDARRLIVLGEEEGAARLEKLRIVVSDLQQASTVDAVHPDLRDPGIVAGVLLKEESAQPVDGDVVEHPAGRIRQQDVDPAAGLWLLDAVERQAPQAAVHEWADAGGGHEVEGIVAVAAGIPGPILRPLHAQDVLGNRVFLELERRQPADIAGIAQLDELEAACADVDDRPRVVGRRGLGTPEAQLAYGKDAPADRGGLHEGSTRESHSW